MFPLYLKRISIFSVAFMLAFLFFTALPVSAQDFGNFGLDETLKTESTINGEGVRVGDALKQESPQITIGRIIGVVLSFLGIVFFVLILVAGWRWMMAQGNEAEIDKAKQTMIAAVTGLIIVLAAYAITAFIGNNLTNAS
ncbi:MAG: hypothetical protein WC415_04530 [Patescibacteria group bacterium]|jgi:cbb3-type cytochrome oxidase subunit 3